MTANVLVIDDDPAMVQAMELVFDRIECLVRGAPLQRQVLSAIVSDPPDLVIAGIDDDGEGWAFCAQLLKLLDVPLFLLLQSDSQADRIRGLEMGAVDCVARERCAPLELAARLRAALRRRRPRAQGHLATYVDGDLAVDLVRQEVWLAGKLVALTPTEFRLLACLAAHAGQPLTYDRLLQELWGPDHTAAATGLRPHVHSLRRKLEPNPAQPRRIVNRRGKGYLLQPIGGQATT